MIPKECKRLAEVDFPIAVVSKHAAREKEARCGHVPKIHIWPAARPTASSRAITLALLLPDPCDSHCPEAFKKTARELLPRVGGAIGPDDKDLRCGLLKFIGEFSSWDLSADRTYLDISRHLVGSAHVNETPLVVDTFAGAGAIPLEALRVGCDAFASDLNPIACLILRTVLRDIPRHGPELAEELRRVAANIKAAAEKELAEFYPVPPDGSKPIAYLWARTVRCESTGCGAEIPLMRSFWLVKKANRKLALRYKIGRLQREPPKIMFEIFEPTNDKEVASATVSRGKASCPACRVVLSPDRVRAQLTEQHGGADVVLDREGNRAGGARLLAVVTVKPNAQGRHYRVATDSDYGPLRNTGQALDRMCRESEIDNLSLIPNENTPTGGGSGAGRAFSVQKYGMMTFADLFTSRQKLALARMCRLVASVGKSSSVLNLLALNFSKMVDMNNNLSTWQPHAEIPAHMMTRFAIPMKWDFSEAVPISNSSGTLESAVKRSTESMPSLLAVEKIGTVQLGDASDVPLPDESAHVWFTDPPYYDAVPYSDLSDFFFVWLKRALQGHPLMCDPFDGRNPLTPKVREIVQDETKEIDGHPKDRDFFEAMMAKAFAEGRRVLREDGIGSVVFAHKTTEGWEALLSGMIKGGWIITGSWPIATEMGSRLRARESAALATSVHLVCRPRTKDRIGDWGDVLRELPKRVGDWMERLQGEGIRGADLVFACIGPALEIYSRYSKVVDAEEREIPLGGDPEAKEPHRRGFLAYVWEVVGRTALEHVLGTAEARARNSMAGALEEDARLTALFLWTLQSTNPSTGLGAGGEQATGNRQEVTVEESEEDEEEEESKKGKGKSKKGYSLVFDVARRFAQPLGIHLDDWEGRIIETEKGIVRLLSVTERAKQLFGEDGAEVIADQLERSPERIAQLALFPDRAEGAVPEIKGRKGRSKKAKSKNGHDLPAAAHAAQAGATTLDRVHAAMLLQASGRTNALRALLKAEQERSPDFLRLANALSALYPKGSDEKRLLDAMLLAVPS